MKKKNGDDLKVYLLTEKHWQLTGDTAAGDFLRDEKNVVNAETCGVDNKQVNQEDPQKA